jgi:hypothetical protein
MFPLDLPFFVNAQYYPILHEFFNSIDNGRIVNIYSEEDVMCVVYKNNDAYIWFEIKNTSDSGSKK